MRLPIKQDYMAVYGACLPKIGLLGELSGPVVLLYSVVKALLDDLAQLQELRQMRMENKPWPVTPGTEKDALLYLTTGTRSWMASALEQAPGVEAKLSEFSKRKFWRCCRK